MGRRRTEIYADSVLTSFDAPLIRDICREYIALQHEANRRKMSAEGYAPRSHDGIPTQFTIDLDVFDERESVMVRLIADEELCKYAERHGVELRRVVA